MADWDRYRDRFSNLCAEWNKAEKVVKQAEQICAVVITPSIKELRYAGRRIIEIIAAIPSGESDDAIQKFFDDAEFDCVRARHDAIDTVTAKVSVDLDNAAQILGYDAICKAFPNFAKLRAKLATMRANIARSRGNREERDTIYSTLATNDLDEIAALYGEFQASEPIMEDMARSERWNRLKNDIFGYAGVAALIVGLIALALWVAFGR